jgi:AraC-like DNA-binding protein
VPDLKPRLTVRAIRPLVSGLRGAGYDAPRILAAVGVDEATFSDPDARVPTSVAMSILSVGVEVTGDSNLGLHIARHADLGSFDVHFYAMASSPTLGTAFERLCRYQRLIHETSRVELEVHGERAVLRHELAAGKAAPRQTAEFLVAAWLRAGRIVTATDWVPQQVHFAHPAPPDQSEHFRVFGCDVHFAMGENALIFPASLLETPCVRADPALVAVLDRYASDRIDLAPASARIADRVEAVVREELRGGEPTAARLAGRLKMSVRSLNRLLAAEGTSYRELLDGIRRDLACRHLATRELSIGEVSFLLGFAELSSFHRAFKRWTGRTPAEFRHEIATTQP